MSLFLFDIDGHPIAFRRTWDDPCVFTLGGTFLGHQPWRSCDVVDGSGHYLGSIVGDRLVTRNDAPHARRAAPVPDPPSARPTGHPGEPLPFGHAFAYRDLDLRAGLRTG